MNDRRRAGILLHPTSLPGPTGRGDLGPAAYAFVDWLAQAGVQTWQVLPLQPPGFGGSPYAATSAFAGDPLLISPDQLSTDGWLTEDDLGQRPSAPEGTVSEDHDDWRRGCLRRAWQRFRDDADPAGQEQLQAFRAEQGYWLDDHALFIALKDAHGGGAFWGCWPEALQRHLPHALGAARREHAEAIAVEVFAQFLFDQQWSALRAHARSRGVELVGDLPIFVARDSSDAWARPELFLFDAAGEPQVVAGVPPDSFSEDGQLWGNPLYDWAIHARTGYGWWIERTRRALQLADVVRIDHFRGFASYWEIPVEAETAAAGRWVPGPGMALFDAIRGALGEVPVVAEDLGELTDDVPILLEASGFPGMRILQFAFYDDDPLHPFKPENHVEACVVYPGTHDNETTAGWFETIDDATRARYLRAVEAAGGDAAQPVWGMIVMALASPAFLAVVPAQDLLGLGNEARINTPAVAEGNWRWRLLPGALDAALATRLRTQIEAHGRRA